jgi:hypothetical protein
MGRNDRGATQISLYLWNIFRNKKTPPPQRTKCQISLCHLSTKLSLSGTDFTRYPVSLTVDYRLLLLSFRITPRRPIQYRLQYLAHTIPNSLKLNSYIYSFFSSVLTTCLQLYRLFYILSIIKFFFLISNSIFLSIPDLNSSPLNLYNSFQKF